MKKNLKFEMDEISPEKMVQSELFINFILWGIIKDLINGQYNYFSRIQADTKLDPPNYLKQLFHIREGISYIRNMVFKRKIPNDNKFIQDTTISRTGKFFQYYSDVSKACLITYE